MLMVQLALVVAIESVYDICCKKFWQSCKQISEVWFGCTGLITEEEEADSIRMEGNTLQLRLPHRLISLQVATTRAYAPTANVSMDYGSGQ